MSNEIKVPTFPESVQEGTIATWHKQPGDAFRRDEVIVEIETDKVVQEVPAPADGVLKDIVRGEGETVTSNEVIATYREGDASASASSAGNAPSDAEKSAEELLAAPAAKKLAEEKGINLAEVTGTGKGGRIIKEDVANYVKPAASIAPTIEPPAAALAPAPKAAPTPVPVAVQQGSGERIEKRVPMTRLRMRIAERLLDATQSTAMLTTFNEVDMAPVMALRNKYKDQFEKVHNGTRLGFMGFFVKAATEALRRIPAVNTSLDGNDVVYHGYQDIGVAVSTDKGLVVPVLRNAENMSLAEVEYGIRDFGLRARDGKIGIEEMQGGTFTITNGGVFGSLMSTPILNPPQAAILGMHKIQERPMAVEGEVKVLPMMYLALSYDHRIIDGKEAVQFLVAIKNMIEDPARILLEL